MKRIANFFSRTFLPFRDSAPSIQGRFGPFGAVSSLPVLQEEILRFRSRNNGLHQRELGLLAVRNGNVNMSRV